MYSAEIRQTATQQKLFECRSENSYFLLNDQCAMTIGEKAIITATINSYNARSTLNIKVKSLRNPTVSGRVTGFFIEC